MEGIPIVVPVRFAGRMLHAALWATQWMLAAVFEFAGLLKACVPVEDLQHKLRFATNAPVAILRPVGVLEIIASLALILPAATQVFPWLTPIAATCLTVIAVLGASIQASGCGLGETLPDLVLAAAAAFVAWGRFGRASIAPFSEQSTGREGARSRATEGRMTNLVSSATEAGPAHATADPTILSTGPTGAHVAAATAEEYDGVRVSDRPPGPSSWRRIP